MRRWLTRFTAHSELFALFAVGVATALFHLSRLYFAPRQWAIFYLLLIALIARISSTRAAIIAAVLSFLAWDYYFIEPFRSVIPADPKDWIGLLGFLFVGIIIGVQTGHLREREETALARARETALLNRLSASMVSISSTQEMVDTILQSICDSIDIHEAILFRDDQGSNGLTPWKLPAEAEYTYRSGNPGAFSLGGRASADHRISFTTPAAEVVGAFLAVSRERVGNYRPGERQ